MRQVCVFHYVIWFLLLDVVDLSLHDVDLSSHGVVLLLADDVVLCDLIWLYYCTMWI